jgi:hypothetical protein
MLLLICGLIGCDAGVGVDPTANTQPTTDTKLTIFAAKVIDINDNFMIIEPIDGENMLPQMEVPTGNIENIKDIQVGHKVQIAYNKEDEGTFPVGTIRAAYIEIIDKTIDIPTLDDALMLSQEQLSSMLKDTKQTDLIAVWGAPDGMLSGLRGDVWNVESETIVQIIVYYNESNLVYEIKLAAKG